MSRSKNWLLGLLLFVAGCSCPGSDQKTECGDFAPVVDAWCAALERCPQAFPLATKTRAECVDLGCFLYTCEVDHDDAPGGVHRDTVAARQPTRSAARREACAAWLQRTGCENLEAFVPPAARLPDETAPGGATPCDGLLSPLAPGFGPGAGSACLSGTCGPGLDCAPPSVNRATATLRCEVCRARPGENETCGNDGGCAAGLACQTLVTSRTCVPPFADGTACTSPQQCASGSCDPVERTCVPRKSAGETCQRAEECTSGRCDLGPRTCAAGCRDSAQCGAGEVCTATGCGAPLENDAPCAASAQCQSRYCQKGFCKPRPDPTACVDTADCRPPYACLDGNCVPTTLACRPRAIGESCKLLNVCDGSSYCDEPSWTCLPRALEGAPCKRPDGCVEGLVCTGASGVCTRPAAEGAPCLGPTDCAAGLACALDPLSGMNVCAALPTGKPCSPTSLCPATHYCAGTECWPRGAEGQGCSVNAPCLDAFYCELGTVCRARRDGGETCGPFVGCGAGLRCGDGGTCEAAAAVGVACTTDEGGKCLPNLYCDTFTGSVCAARLGEGQACTRDAQCQSGACAPSFGCLASAACVLER